MKKLALLMASLFVVSITNVFSQSDMLERIVVKDGYQKAFEEAVGNGISGPQLMMAATIDQEITAELPPSNTPVTLTTDFQLNDGKSRVWIYTFRDPSNHDNQVSYLVGNVTFLNFGYVAFEVDLDEYIDPELPIFGDTPIDIEAVLNSDQMGSIFSGNTSVQQFKSENPDLDNELVALTVNPALEFITGDTPLWVLFMNAGAQTRTCAINNDTQENLCDDQVTSVDETNDANVEVYPQPAENYISIDLDGSINSVSVFDIYGNEINSIRYDVTAEGILINTEQMGSGVYIILVSTDQNRFSKRVVISR